MRCSCMQVGCLVGEIKTAKQRYLGTFKRSRVALLLFVIDLVIRVLFMKARATNTQSSRYQLEIVPEGCESTIRSIQHAMISIEPCAHEQIA